jgi:biopolymer transport protein ExbD
MAEVQSNDSGGDKGGKHKKVRAKKNSTHIDMTPMVDLAFLLLTFFMLTTTFGKPKTMEITMPVKPDKPEEQVPVNNALTILLTGNDKVYWYYGEFKPETQLTKSSFGNDGIRKVILDYNKNAVTKITQLRQQAAKSNMADTTLHRMEVDIKGEKASVMVLVKTDDKAKYKNVVDMLDELNVCFVGKYALVDIMQKEYELVNAQPN